LNIDDLDTADPNNNRGNHTQRNQLHHFSIGLQEKAEMLHRKDRADTGVSKDLLQTSFNDFLVDTSSMSQQEKSRFMISHWSKQLNEVSVIT